MKILYYSCHEILEYDEVRLFRALGYSVFSLGAIFDRNNCLRPLLDQDDPDGALTRIFDETGCVKGSFYNDYRISSEFVREFDVVIVMSDAGFILNNWSILKIRPVIWRTVGMGTWIQEYFLAQQRREGLKIVRYSPAERVNPAYLGEDAIIRFYVDVAPVWTGQNPVALTFANDFRRRNPDQFDFFSATTAGISVRIGGAFNDGLTGCIGVVSDEVRKHELQTSRVYLYLHGIHIPYTLNFIEAWARTAAPPLDGSYSEVAN